MSTILIVKTTSIGFPVRARPISQIALFPFGMQQVRGNQQVVLLKEAFDLCLTETMFLAMSPIPIIPLKAGKL